MCKFCTRSGYRWCRPSTRLAILCSVSAIFYLDEAQRQTAEQVKAEVDASGKWPKPVVTQIVKATAFYDAEEYHQHYLQKNPGGYTCHFVRD